MRFLERSEPPFSYSQILALADEEIGGVYLIVQYFSLKLLHKFAKLSDEPYQLLAIVSNQTFVEFLRLKCVKLCL